MTQDGGCTSVSKAAAKTRAYRDPFADPVPVPAKTHTTLKKHNEVEVPGAQDAFTVRLVETQPSTLGEIQRVGHNSLIVRSKLSWKHGELFFPAVCPQCLA